MPVNMNRIVNVIPTLIESTGSGYNESGLLLTQDTSLPYGKVYTFASADAVEAFFGPTSPLVNASEIYFNGPDNKTKVPKELLISSYITGNSNAWLRGAALTETVAQFATITNGYVTLVVNGEESFIDGIDLSGSESYTTVASKLQTAIAAVHSGYTVTYDLIRKAFKITGNATVALGYAVLTTESGASGTELATILGLTAAAGATISDPFTGTKTIADIMDNICLKTENWYSFTTDWQPEIDDRLEFSAWNSGKYSGARFIYAEYDMDGAAISGSSEADFASRAVAAGYASSLPIYGIIDHAVFALSCGACVNREELNGRYSLAGKHQTGLAITVDNSIDYDVLAAKGYSCYADFATAGNTFRWFQKGAITGKYKWFDALQGHVWLNDNIQVNCADLIDTVKAFPYSQQGYGMIDSAISQAANAAVYNGVATKGVTLSESQKAQLMADIGFDISDALYSAGYYTYITDPSASVRADRGSPIIKFYYMDGGVIQTIDVISNAIL